MVDSGVKKKFYGVHHVPAEVSATNVIGSGRIIVNPHTRTCESCATCLFTRTRTSYHLVPGYFVPARVLMHSTRVIVFALMVVYRVPGYPYVSVADIVADIVQLSYPYRVHVPKGFDLERFLSLFARTLAGRNSYGHISLKGLYVEKTKV